ncbi:MAG: hypothetical protein HY843_08075 [Bdellovibrio sp.]|nr:hypothetical protein [Bdellovibrio sp.]
MKKQLSSDQVFYRHLISEKKKIAFVEDDMGLEQIMCSTLSTFGIPFDWEWFTSAEVLLKKVQASKCFLSEKPYDLVVLDIFLNGNVTGIDLWNFFNSVYPKMPVLLMSSLSLHKIFEFLGKKQTYPCFLQKPFRIKDLKSILGSYLLYNPA